MVMSVIGLMADQGEVNYYSPGFQNIIESHLVFLKDTSVTVNTPVEGAQEEKYRGDFYGLLFDLNIPAEYHWTTMRMNGLHSPMDYRGNMISIITPAKRTMELLLRRWMNSTARV